jgi:hypothetical protein
VCGGAEEWLQPTFSMKVRQGSLESLPTIAGCKRDDMQDRMEAALQTGECGSFNNLGNALESKSCGWLNLWVRDHRQQWEQTGYRKPFPLGTKDLRVASSTVALPPRAITTQCRKPSPYGIHLRTKSFLSRRTKCTFDRSLRVFAVLTGHASCCIGT